MNTPVCAHSFELFACDDPDCGPHIVAFDEHGRPICQMVLSLERAPEFIRGLQSLLYDKAVEKDA